MYVPDSTCKNPAESHQQTACLIIAGTLMHLIGIVASCRFCRGVWSQSDERPCSSSGSLLFGNETINGTTQTIPLTLFCNKGRRNYYLHLFWPWLLLCKREGQFSIEKLELILKIELLFFCTEFSLILREDNNNVITHCLQALDKDVNSIESRIQWYQ